MTLKTWGILAAVIDAVLIVLFALIGRGSHGEQLSVGGLWETSWPFLVGWAIGYITTGAWARPLRIWPTAVVIWILTVCLGMALRVWNHQGIDHGNPLPISFLIVASIVLAVFLIGWRVVVRLVLGRERTALLRGARAADRTPGVAAR
ncbi:DUF3054 domain-containing protein [Curtobacterium ammoniigenes]|uniref:DUF3054 domain-containing protein n=1 Tax=Curtobacterium ammoniigenes TaxID=395387 RepID=UPI00082AB4B1|nr:DUF3054 domain-containing protein [Curtobacterium ammoniigenes]